MSLTAVVLTKNEERNIRQCLECLKFCDETIVIDDESSDLTRQIAKKAGAEIYIRKLEGDFAAQRNFALRHAQGEWILFVDADERVSRQLASEIIQVINNLTIHFNGFYLKRDDFLWGRRLRHGEIGAIRLLRLAKKGEGEWKRRIHEVWEIRGDTYQLSNPLMHYPHQSLREFISDINLMSDVDALAKQEEGRKSSILKVILWPKGKFLYNFIFRGGFLDGMQGFIVTLIMSFHSFLSWSKLWITQKKI